MTAAGPPHPATGSHPISGVAPPRSLGIRWYAQTLVTAMRADGLDLRLTDRAPGRERLHLHLGNSTRSLIPAVMVARRPALVTVHDVVPRDPRLRPPWRVIAPRLFAGHRLIAHSQYARSMLRGLGVAVPVDVVRLAVAEQRLPAERMAAARAELAPDGRPIALCAGVLKRAKGVLDVLEVAPAFPEVVFAFAGTAADEATRTALAAAPANVVHRPGLDAAAFEAALAAADVLVNLRRDSVGEASAPVVQAHGLGTPVVGYRDGALPEYCGEGDLLVDPDVPVADVLARVAARLAAGWPRLPPGAPQVMTWAAAAARHREIYTELGWASAPPRLASGRTARG
jgi:glycosyltransferase involved in cell wall biosynthesis